MARSHLRMRPMPAIGAESWWERRTAGSHLKAGDTKFLLGKQAGQTRRLSQGSEVRHNRLFRKSRFWATGALP